MRLFCLLTPLRMPISLAPNLYFLASVCDAVLTGSIDLSVYKKKEPVEDEVVEELTDQTNGWAIQADEVEVDDAAAVTSTENFDTNTVEPVADAAEDGFASPVDDQVSEIVENVSTASEEAPVAEIAGDLAGGLSEDVDTQPAMIGTPLDHAGSVHDSVCADATVASTTIVGDIPAEGLNLEHDSLGKWFQSVVVSCSYKLE